MRKMWDAAYPPANPPQMAAVAGYIGGAAPNIWTDQEWSDSLRKSGARYKLPIFVRVPPTIRDPRVEAQSCIDWARAHGQPQGTLICLDYETAVNATYLNAFDDKIVAAGYKCIVYGSRSAVLQNPEPSGGYWTATWNNVPHLDAGATITQYGGDVTLGQPYDLSLVADSAPLWDIGGTVSATGPASWDAADWTAVNEHLRGPRAVNLSTVQGKVEATYNQVNTKAAEVKAALTSLGADLVAEEDQTQAALAALAAAVQGGGVDATVLANALLEVLDPKLAKGVADELYSRLAP